ATCARAMGEVSAAMPGTTPAPRRGFHRTCRGGTARPSRRPGDIPWAAMAADDFPTVTYGGGRSSRIWWVVGIVALLVIVAAAIALRIAFSQLPPGTTLAGVDVRTPADAQRLTSQIATALVDLPVELTTAAGSTTVSAGR